MPDSSLDIMGNSVISQQLLVAGSLQLASLTVGVAVAYPGVLLQQLSVGDQSIDLDLNTASWIGSIHGLAGLPSILMPIFMQSKGRKLAFIAAVLINLVGWIITYVSSSAAEILASESVLGLGSNCILIVGLSSISEMVKPKYRNISMVTYYILETIGIGAVGVMGKYLDWRTISLIMCFPLILTSIAAYTWAESPYWLAFMQRYNDCEKAFVKLRGTDDKSKQELTDLILKSKENSVTKEADDIVNIASIIKTVKEKDFYVPTVLIFVLLAGTYWSGILVAIIYVSDIMRRVTNNEVIIANSCAVVNITFIIGAVFVNVLNRFLKYKTIILGNVSLLAIVGIVTSAVTYIQSIGVIDMDSLMPAILIYTYIAIVCCSTNSFTLSAELMPVKHKGIGGGLFVIITCLMHSSSLKLYPYLLVYVNVWGTFLIFSLNAIICGLIIWKFVPETKGRTLLEIEEYYENMMFI